MRAVLTVFVFFAGIAAVVLVHAPRAHAAWRAPQAIDAGHSPKVAYAYPHLSIAYAQGSPFDASRLLVSAGNEPHRRLRVPSAGRLTAFDVDAAGRLVALREAKRRILALIGNRWRRISGATAAVDAKLAVAQSGAAVAAWMQREKADWVVHAAIRQPDAGRFGPAQRLSGPASRRGRTFTVAVDDAARAVVTWTEAGDLTMARTVGRSFGTPVRVHDRTPVVAGAFAAASAVGGSTAVVAFTRLEDREPPEHRLSVATQVGDATPLVETVAANVSALDLDAAVGANEVPYVLGAPIGPPYSLRVHRRTTAWEEHATIVAGGAPSTVDLAIGGGRIDPGARERHCVTWTQSAGKGFAWIDGERFALGRAADPDCGIRPDGQTAAVVWDRGGSRGQRLAEWFMPTP